MGRWAFLFPEEGCMCCGVQGVAHAAVASKPLRSSPPPAAPASPGRADMDGDSAEKRERMRKKGKDRAVKKEKRRGGKDKGTEGKRRRP